MKHTLPKFATVASLLVVLSLPALAQSAEDPYKKNSTGTPVADSMAQSPQVSLHLETFSLPIRDAFSLLREFPTDEGRYNQLVTLSDQGKAKIDGLIVLRTKSGQRAVVESIHELRYPTQFDVREGTKNPQKPEDSKLGNGSSNIPSHSVYPSAFETRNVGDTFEVEPVVNTDGTVDVNLVPQSVHYLGDRERQGTPGFQQPLFETQKTTTSATVRAGQPFLLVTPNAPFGTGLDEKAEEQRISLQFITAHIIPAAGTAHSPERGASAHSPK